MTSKLVATFAFGLVSLLAPFLAFAETTEITTAIRVEISRLLGGEAEALEALEKLSQRSRVSVITILRDELNATPHPRASVLRATARLHAKELLPELRQLANKSDDWQVFQAMGELADANDTALFIGRLKGPLPPAARVAVLDILGRRNQVISRELFEAQINDANFEVRRAVFRHFLTTRERLPQIEQSYRFQLGFKSRPFQVRLEALKGFSRLSARERAGLKLTFDVRQCTNETNPEVRTVCSRVPASADLVKPSKGRK